MNSRQRFKAIKKHGRLVYSNAEIEYDADTWNYEDGSVMGIYPAMYYVNPYYDFSGFYPVGTKKNQNEFSYLVLDKDDMTFETAYTELAHPLNWKQETEVK